MSEKPEIYYRVSQTQLSVASYYGGATVEGVSYIYEFITDRLFRGDLIKKGGKHHKEFSKLTKKSRQLLEYSKTNKAAADAEFLKIREEFYTKFK